MNEIAGIQSLASPSLLFDVDAIERNIDRMLELAGGDPDLLRPHIKTHKCEEILKLQSERGITRVKCATIAEAELAARAGVPDILVSYPLVGPNAARLAELMRKRPELHFSCLVDSTRGLEDLAAAADDIPIRAYLDLDCGMHRTGIESGPAAVELVSELIRNPRLEFEGIHAYDGHIHDASIEARQSAFEAAMSELDAFLALLEKEGIEVPRIASGGSPTFALHANRATASDREWQCSPGTTLLWDAGYGEHYPDLAFDPAALLLTRIVSHPGPDNLVTLDIGHKAVSGENPIGNRVRLPGLDVLEFVSQSEEHLVVALANRDLAPVGTEVIGIPYHVCPTVALYQRAQVVSDGNITGETWEIAARDRRLTI